MSSPANRCWSVAGWTAYAVVGGRTTDRSLRSRSRVDTGGACSAVPWPPRQRGHDAVSGRGSTCRRLGRLGAPSDRCGRYRAIRVGLVGEAVVARSRDELARPRDGGADAPFQLSRGAPTRGIRTEQGVRATGQQSAPRSTIACVDTCARADFPKRRGRRRAIAPSCSQGTSMCSCYAM